MRPDRAVVKKAIVDTANNLSRAAALLGCSRQTLYTWIYQLGLERFAGVCMDTRVQLDRQDRQDARVTKENKSGVYSGPAGVRSLHVVSEAATVSDLPIQATMRVRESLWKRVKIEAIRRGCTVAELADEAFERVLQGEAPEKKARKP